LKLTLARNDSAILGVCGGLGEFLGWSATRLRVIWLLSTIFTAFAGAILYLLLWYLMPYPKVNEQADRRTHVLEGSKEGLF
jgi:phage shock protein PspC (stress-responsive transcriptional regulator)